MKTWVWPLEIYFVISLFARSLLENAFFIVCEIMRSSKKMEIIKITQFMKFKMEEKFKNLKKIKNDFDNFLRKENKDINYVAETTEFICVVYVSFSVATTYQIIIHFTPFTWKNFIVIFENDFSILPVAFGGEKFLRKRKVEKVDSWLSCFLNLSLENDKRTFSCILTVFENFYLQTMKRGFCFPIDD